MAQTFFINHLLDELVPPSAEMPITAITQHPYLEHFSPLAIYNPDGSNMQLNIKRIKIRPLITQSTTLPTAFNIIRISGHSGGTDLTPQPMDTTNMSIDGIVGIKIKATVVAGSTLQRNMNMQTLNFAAAGRGLAARNLGQTRTNCNNAELFRTGYIDTDTQPITLNGQEGFAITMATVPLTKAFQIYCLFRVYDGMNLLDHTYFLEETIRPEAVDTMFSLMNLNYDPEHPFTVYIHQLLLQEIGDDSIPQFIIEKIDGLSGGDDVTPTKMDTANDAITAIQIKQNCLVKLAGYKTGAIIVNPAYKRTMPNIYGKGAGFAGLTFGNAEKFKEINCYNASQDIILTEGQGISLRKSNASEIGKFEIYIEFTKTAISGGGGSGGSYTWG